MVLLPSLLFVRRKRYQQDNESLPVQDEDKHEENIETIKNNKTNFPKIHKKKNNKQYQTDQQYNNKEKITYGKSKRTNSRKSSLNNPKRIILHLTLLKNKTKKIFNRIFRRKGKLKKSFKTRLCQQFQKDSFKSSNIYGLSKTNTISTVNTKNIFNTEELLSGGTSTTDIWNEEWEITPTVCAKRQSFVFEDNLETNNENINNLYCDWSRDSVFCSDSESEDFYSAVESQRESPVSERLLIINDENSEDEDDYDDDLKSKENENNGLNIFLESGYTVKDLLEMGCDIKDLVVAGCGVEDLLKSGCSVKDLLKSGCKVMDILAYIDDEQTLLNSGYSVQELVEYKSRVEELLEPKPEKRQELKRRLAAGEELYPTCDVSIWLRTCREEILKPLSGVTTGIIPKWLKGTLLRNGPGSLTVGNDQFEHLFDGSALIHRFGIENGEVRYQCKFVETNTFKKNHAAQRIVVTEFGTAGVPDPCQSIFQRISVLFNPGETLSDNAMISVYPFGDEFYAFAENAVIHRIDPSTLESTGRMNVSKHVGIVNHTSHPHVLNDGSVYNVGISIRCTGPHYSVVKFPPALYTDVNGIKSQVRSPFEQAQIVATVPARWKLNPSYMHTFGITDNYFVIVEQPLSVSFTTLFKRHLKNQPMAPSLKWHKNEQTRIHLLNRKTGEPVAKFLADAFFFLHIINQYEEKNHLVLDISCYKDATMLDCMYINALKQANQNLNYAEMFRGRPLRFVLPLTSPDEGSWGTNLVTLPGSKATAYRFMDNNIFVCPELICDLGCETPRIYYEKHLGKPYRYFYAISSDVDLDNPGTLIKVDTVKKTTKTWCEDNVFPSEPVFVPSPETKSEDDGMVLSAMVWTKGMENKVGLLVLDAVTWTELGRTVFVTPSPVPKCLHGWFTDYCS